MFKEITMQLMHEYRDATMCAAATGDNEAALMFKILDEVVHNRPVSHDERIAVIDYVGKKFANGNAEYEGETIGI